MKKILKSAMLVALTAAGFTACSDEYDPGVYTPGDKQREEFAKNFEEMFGEINPEQDWTIATRGEVTVTSNTNSNVKIYAKTNGDYSLIGDFDGFIGTRTLKFDMRKGTKELLVSCGTQTQFTFVGSNVNFGASTRTAHPSADGKTVTETAETKIFEAPEVTAWEAILPEAGDRSKLAANNGSGLTRATADFTYISTGDILFYPLYWNTSASYTIGIYYEGGESTYKDGQGKTTTSPITMFPVYTVKSGDEIQTCGYEWEYFANDELVPENAEDFNAINAGYILDDDWSPNRYNEFRAAEWEDWYESGVYKGRRLKTPARKSVPTYNFVSAGSGNTMWGNNFAALKSKAIKISLEPGTKFGFYLQRQDQTFFSSSMLNGDAAAVDEFNADGTWIRLKDKTYDANDVTTHANHAATFTHAGVTYLGFEDWPNGNAGNSSDFDLNDFMCVLGGATPIVVDEDPEVASWVVACEDLGDTHDIDFNDVVFKVSHISGRDYAHVTPLAAAGTLQSEVYFGEQRLGEIHELLGGAAPTIINGITQTNFGTSIQISVDKDNFTMAYIGEDDNQNLGGFSIKTEGNDQKVSSADGKITITSKNTKGKAPQIIVLPAKYNRHVSSYSETGDWCWPKEGVYIGTAYNLEGHSFTDWVTSNVTDWYNNFNDAEVVKNGTVEQVLDNDPVDPDPEEGGDSSRDAIYTSGRTYTSGKNDISQYLSEDGKTVVKSTITIKANSESNGVYIGDDNNSCSDINGLSVLTNATLSGGGWSFDISENGTIVITLTGDKLTKYKSKLTINSPSGGSGPMNIIVKIVNEYSE